MAKGISVKPEPCGVSKVALDFRTKFAKVIILQSHRCGNEIVGIVREYRPRWSEEVGQDGCSFEGPCKIHQVRSTKVEDCEPQFQ